MKCARKKQACSTRPYKTNSRSGRDKRRALGKSAIGKSSSFTFLCRFSTPNAERSTLNAFPPSPQGRVGTSNYSRNSRSYGLSPSPQGRVKVGCGVRCAKCGVSNLFVAVLTPHSEPSTPHSFPPSPQGRVGLETVPLKIVVKAGI